jgi:phenylacetate-CoA ligase
MILKLVKYYLSLYYWNLASIEKVRKMQIRKFRKIFEYAKVHSKFYSQLYKDAGVYELKIRTFKDIEKLPVIDKNILRKYNYEDILTTKITEKINEHSTSGSSGEPFKFYFDKFTDYTSHTRVFYALCKAGKYNPFKKMTIITRYDENGRFQVEGDIKALKKIQKALGILEREIISIYRDADFIIDKIILSKPYILWSTPSILEIVVNRLIERGISMQIPYLFFTSENLSLIQYKKFHKYLSKNIVDIYGAMESPCLGYEINKSGKRIVFPNSNLFEYVNVRESETGKAGDVLITNLLNFTMPIIRYDLKDIGVVLHDKNFPNKIIGEIVGRIDDILDFPDGKKFAHHHAHEMFMNFHECEMFKFIQKPDKSVVLQLKIAYGQDKSFVEQQAYKRWSHRYRDTPIIIEFVDKFEINPQTGKFKNIEIQK